jgi:hypothetical protein
MTIKQPFAPSYGSGQTVTPAAAAATITLTPGSKQLMLTNLGAAVCYVRIGQGSVANASTVDFPIPPNFQVPITKSSDADKLSHISAAGTTLHIINGEGF